MVTRRAGAGAHQATSVLAATLLVATLSACGLVGGGSHPLFDRQHQQARDALERWADAVAAAGGQQGLAVVGDKTGQIGSWEESVGDHHKRALIAGKVAAVITLPDERPTTCLGAGSERYAYIASDRWLVRM